MEGFNHLHPEARSMKKLANLHEPNNGESNGKENGK